MQKEWKQKSPKKRFVRFRLWLQKGIFPKKNWVDKGTKFAGEFEKLCKAEGRQIYSTMSETKAALAERTTRSLENILYRYMEDKGYKCIHKLTQFVATLNSRRNCSIDLIPKNVKNSDFFPFCTANHYENLENPSLKSATKFAYRSMTYRSGSVISHNLHGRFSKLFQFFSENFQHTH